MLADCNIVSKVCSNYDLDTYLHYWFLVNSRTFYYEFYDEKPPESHDDRIVMVPFMDYFNHADHGVSGSVWIVGDIG